MGQWSSMELYGAVCDCTSSEIVLLSPHSQHCSPAPDCISVAPLSGHATAVIHLQPWCQAPISPSHLTLSALSSPLSLSPFTRGPLAICPSPLSSSLILSLIFFQMPSICRALTSDMVNKLYPPPNPHTHRLAHTDRQILSV